MRPNWEISAAKTPFATFMQPLHFTIYGSQLQKALQVFCTQPQQRGTWTQPFHGDLQRLSCKTQKNYPQRLHKLQLQNRISTPKRKNDDFEALFKRNLKRKIITTKMQKNLLPKHLSQLSCCHYNAIYDSQLENTTVLRTHPHQQGTLTQPFHGDLQRLSCKTQKNYPQRLHKLQLQNRISTPKRKNDDFEELLKRNFKRKIIRYHQHQNEK